MDRVTPLIPRNKALEALMWLFGLAGATWLSVTWILAGSLAAQAQGVVLVFGLFIAILAICKWRSGFYLFLVWIVFEDAARKFLGNNMYVYFGKDILVAVIYVSFFYGISRQREKVLRIPFWVPLLAFFWWAVMEALNPASPSMIYGLLGLKLYFYYVPLLFVGYSLMRTENDLRRFLLFNATLGALVSFLGIVQGIVGQNFLNPAVVDESLVLYEMRGTSGNMFYRGNSVFVSDGRFGAYLILMWALGFGTIGYLTSRRSRRSIVFFLCAAVVAAAILLSGVRTALVYSLLGTGVMGIAWFYGASLSDDQWRRINKGVRRGVLFAVAGVLCVAILYPSALARRWAFYSETLSLDGPGSQLALRGWVYPIEEFTKTFALRDWQFGRGLGTASVGTQYITRFLGVPPPGATVENGYGNLLIEVGVPGLLLWIVFTAAVVRACWVVTKGLRKTPMFPLAFSIFWLVFIWLFPLSFVGLTTYEDFIVNAYLWTLVGVLFRLPALLEEKTLAVTR